MKKIINETLKIYDLIKHDHKCVPGKKTRWDICRLGLQKHRIKNFIQFFFNKIKNY